MDISQPTEPLSYATPLPPASRPVWVYVVLGTYLAIVLAVLAVPFFFASGDLGVFATVVGFDAIFLLAGWLMVSVPVRVRRQRGVARRSIWQPLAGSAILILALCVGTGLGTLELLKADSSNLIALAIGGSLLLLWIGWIVLFYLVSRSLDPVSFSARLYKFVLAGSALELLIAVPMHVVVRRRHECCGGLATGFAICMGVMTAVIALGPGMFFLFYRRWKEVYRNEMTGPQP